MCRQLRARRRSKSAAALTGLNAEIVSSEYLHALDYLVYAYLQVGADTQAAELVEQVLAVQGPYGEMSRGVSAYALAAHRGQLCRNCGRPHI